VHPEWIAQVPTEDHPESVAVLGPWAYVATTTGVEGFEAGDGRASRIYAFNRFSGHLADTLIVSGEDPNRFRGIAGQAFDGMGRLYACDLQGRVLRFNVLSKVQETYATIPDLPTCSSVGSGVPCSPTAIDEHPLPNDLAFDNDGNLYVTDSAQATIFRIPPNGSAEIWYQDAVFDSPAGFGPNGIRVSPDGETIFMGVSIDDNSQAVVYTLPRIDNPVATDLETFFTYDVTFEPLSGLDGIAFGTSGKIYVTLFGIDEISVLNSDGTEDRRIASPLFDEPAVLAFDGKSGSVFVPQHAFFNTAPQPRDIAKVCLNDTGVPLITPLIP